MTNALIGRTLRLMRTNRHLLARVTGWTVVILAVVTLLGNPIFAIFGVLIPAFVVFTIVVLYKRDSTPGSTVTGHRS